MKKIILILISCMMLIGIFVLTASAKGAEAYTCYMEFENTKKAYPLASNVEDCIGFFDYYGEDSIRYSLYFDAAVYPDLVGVTVVDFNMIKDLEFITLDFNVSGSYPNIGCDVITSEDGNFTDFGFIYTNGIISVVKIYNDEKTVFINDLDSFITEKTGDPYCENWIYTDLTADYYVELPENDGPVVEVPDEDITPLPQALIEVTFITLGGFVGGVGSAFNSAFTSLFIVNGMLNSLAIFVLVFGGIGLGYGIVRFVTGLFRKKGE